jgi:nucleotide-binding universal stress UspA family protein
MKILLPTDGSEHSEVAAKFLTCLNLSVEDEITIFHTTYWGPPLWYIKEFGEESHYKALKAIKKEIAPRIIDSVLRILQPVKARISTAIVEGCSAEDCIIEAAVDSDMDLIVMGAQGIRGIKSFFIGSVTREVSIKAPKPVLIVKLPTHEKPAGLKVLFATDGSDNSRDTGKFLSRAPFYDDMEISILNVMPSEALDIPRTFDPGVIEEIIDVEEKIRETRVAESKRIIEYARELLGKKFSSVNVISEFGDSSREILKIAEELKANLIVVGCRGLRGIKGMMGSVSRNILSHSECSVLIGKTCKD